MKKYEDKITHISFSFMLATIATLATHILFGVAFAFACGLAKEYYDAFKKGGSGWSWADVLADLIGILIWCLTWCFTIK